MCEETGRAGRGLENKLIYVPLLFVAPGGQRYDLNTRWLQQKKTNNNNNNDKEKKKTHTLHTWDE